MWLALSILTREWVMEEIQALGAIMTPWTDAWSTSELSGSLDNRHENTGSVV